MIKTAQLNTIKPKKAVLFFRDMAISTLMLGLLLAFSKMVKFVVILIQDLMSLNNTFTNELESIERGSNFYVYNYEKMTRSLEKSNELNITAESINSQISSSQLSIIIFLFVAVIAFVVLYFALDFLIEYTNKFKPWSIIFLLIAFVSSVIYLEFTDLYYSGNGYCFMFTTIISIVTGLVLVGYTLIFPNYQHQEE